eukprot:scaffold4272_cov129-Isochrysis_galbana.AAC.1
MSLRLGWGHAPRGDGWRRSIPAHPSPRLQPPARAGWAHACRAQNNLAHPNMARAWHSSGLHGPSPAGHMLAVPCVRERAGERRPAQWWLTRAAAPCPASLSPSSAAQAPSPKAAPHCPGCLPA